MSATMITPEKPPGLPRRPIEHDILLASLPHPILVLAEDDRIVYANAAAESFLSTSLAMLKRSTLDELLAFGCPLLALLHQVRRSGATVNEYGMLLATPRVTLPRLVDVYAGPYPDQPGLVVLMLQQRTMAQMIERQLTHRAAAGRCRAWRGCWRTRSRTRCRASAARRNCSSRRSPTRTAR